MTARHTKRVMLAQPARSNCGDETHDLEGTDCRRVDRPGGWPASRSPDGSDAQAHGRAVTGSPALNHTIRVMPAHLAMSVTCVMFGGTRLNHPVGSWPIEVGVATFAGLNGAEHAFADARDRDPGAGWIGDAAFVEVHRHGRIVVRGTVLGHYVDVDGLGDVIGPDTAAGAIVGAAAGLPLGPSGFAAGLVGGATAGGASEASEVTEPEKPAFDAIRAQVPEGSSAAVVFADTERIRAMYGALFAGADTFVRHRLSPAAEAGLRAALAETPPTTTDT
jgi:hypothetical protein